MRFSPTFLDEIRDRVPISAVIGQRVSWDRRKTNAARGDYWACCPFHGEKSPSFHCEDKKGRYHCFGCGVSGDHFRFLSELDGLGFPGSGGAHRRYGRRADAGARRSRRTPRTPARQPARCHGDGSKLLPAAIAGSARRQGSGLPARPWADARHPAEIPAGFCAGQPQRAEGASGGQWASR